MKVYIGSDHAGFRLKAKIIKYLTSKNIKFEDLGNIILDKDDDYPDYGIKVAQAVAKSKIAKGIAICGSSLGACIVANKVKGIRAVSARSEAEARLSRKDNDANVLCLSGGDFAERGKDNMALSEQVAKNIINVWLTTEFSKAPRHQRRINKIKKIENKNFVN